VICLQSSQCFEWGGRNICDVQTEVGTAETVAFEPGAFDIEVVAENFDFV